MTTEVRLRKICNLILRAKALKDKADKAERAAFDLIGGQSLDSYPTAAENADNLADAISCFINYGEYNIVGLMEEINNFMERETDD